MACDYFDIGILRPDGRMLLREGWSVSQIEEAIHWLRRENAHGAHLFVRPHPAHALSLVDDLSTNAIAAMKESGFHPALVVETSPRNFQVWLNHGRIISDHFVSTQVAKELARRFGGDPSSADWRHFGRLAGFTNQKPERRLETGLPPFVRLREYDGRVYSAAVEFTDELTALVQRELAIRETREAVEPLPAGVPMRPLRTFHDDPRYGGDLHRADLAWAIYAASRALSEEQIRDEIAYVRDLSKKGRPERQLNYARRTAIKAASTVEPLR